MGKALRRAILATTVLTLASSVSDAYAKYVVGAGADVWDLFIEGSAEDYPMRPLVTMDQLSTLATTWYATRLQEDSRRPQPDEMPSIFAGLGLAGDFWDLQSDSFG